MCANLRLDQSKIWEIADVRMDDVGFYYLKIGEGNKLARKWLKGENPLQRPAVVVFFGKATVEQIRRKEPAPELDYLTFTKKSQLQHFVSSGLPKSRDKTVMIVISDGCAWFLRPAGKVIEREPKPGDVKSDALWKMMPVNILRCEKLADVPAVLAGINSDNYLVRGTYRKIRHWGNIKAICCTLGYPLPKEHLEPEALTAIRLLECLSSVGLETLVAKVFEAAGCFVPAYRGGVIRDVDLFAHNYGKKPVALGELVVGPGERVSIEVKSRKKLPNKPGSVDYLVALQAPALPGCFGAEWLLSQVRRYPEVQAWLERSLAWLPADYLGMFGL